MTIYQPGRTPYLYSLLWTEHNIGYVGVRYAQGCHPSDLWTTYFTSSNYVKAFRETYGDPDCIDIIDTFLTCQEAIDAEYNHISTFELHMNSAFLNKNAGGCVIWDDEMRAAHKLRMRRVLNRPATREKMSQKAKERCANPVLVRERADVIRSYWQDPEWRAKQMARKRVGVTLYLYKGIEYSWKGLGLVHDKNPEDVRRWLATGMTVDEAVENAVLRKRRIKT